MYFAAAVEMYLFFVLFSAPERNLSLPIFVSAGFITLHEFVNFYREDTLEGWQGEKEADKSYRSIAVKREKQSNADKLHQLRT